MKNTSAMINAQQRVSKTHLPLLVTIIITLLVNALVVLLGMHSTQSTFIYGLDDAYIHLSIAKNFFSYGYWGVASFQVVSATSSPLWTLLLSAFGFLKDSLLYVPIIFNILFQIATLTVLEWWLSRISVRPVWQIFWLLQFILGTPFPALTVSGMEQSMFLFFLILFTILQIQSFTDTTRSRLTLRLIFASLAVATRYEALFIILPFAFLSLLRKEYKTSLCLLAASVLPIVIYGGIMVHAHQSFIPNSIAVKTLFGKHQISFSTAAWQTIYQSLKTLASPTYLYLFIGTLLCFAVPPLLNHRVVFSRLRAFNLLLCIVLLVLLSMVSTSENWHTAQRIFTRCIFLLLLLTVFWRVRFSCRNIFDLSIISLAIATCTAIILHLTFAALGQLFRYESYLIVLILLVAIMIFYHPMKRQGFRILIGSYLIALFCIRIPFGFYTATRAPKNIFDQQYQIAMFIHSYCPRCSVALNDIGIVSYYNPIELLDVFGLASNEVLTLKQKTQYTRKAFSDLVKSRHVEIAFLYDNLFLDRTPSDWERISSWITPNPLVLGSDTVSFYTVRGPTAEIWRSRMKEYVTNALPPDVQYVVY
jgi:hypothetical protein